MFPHACIRAQNGGVGSSFVPCCHTFDHNPLFAHAV